MAKKTLSKGLINITIDNPFARSLKKFPEDVQQEIKRVVEETTDTLFQRIKDDTPRDRGDAGGAVSKWKKQTVIVDVDTVEQTITNDAPHINVLEFGGYPVISKKRNRPNATGPGFVRGNAVLGGYPPGKRTAIAPGGTPIMTSNVSSGGVKASQGMVRKNLEGITGKFEIDLEEAIEEAFEKLGDE